MAEIMWLVPAGEDGFFINDDFYLYQENADEIVEEFRTGFIFIGGIELGDLSAVTSQEEIRERYNRAYPDEEAAKASNAVAMMYKFRCKLEADQKLATYDPRQREYLIGNITSDYYYNTYEDDDLIDYKRSYELHHHVRRVDWLGRVSRAALSVSSRYLLSNIQTLSLVNEEVATELLSHLGKSTTPENTGVDDSGLNQIKEDTVARVRELIKDKLMGLSLDEMEQLAAAILRAMGYKTSVIPKKVKDPGVGFVDYHRDLYTLISASSLGERAPRLALAQPSKSAQPDPPDDYVDFDAFPDGLGLKGSRINVRVRHRPGPAITFKPVDIYTTDGYGRRFDEVIVQLDELVSLVGTHYESFNYEIKRLIPLVKVYFPTE